MLRDPCRWPISFNETVFLGVAFFSLFVIGNRLVRFVCPSILEFDCPRYWPISVLTPRAPPNFHYPNLIHIAIAGFTVLVFVLAVRVLERRHYPTSGILVFGTILILGSNLTQGWQHAFVRPIDGLGVLKNQYYHDAIRIENPIRFVSEFTRD